MASVEESPGEFLADRADWLRVAAVETEHGSWGVVLVLDGYYADRAMAEGMAQHLAERLGKVLRFSDPLPLGLIPSNSG